MPFSTTARHCILEKHTRLPLWLHAFPTAPKPQVPVFVLVGSCKGQVWLPSHGLMLVLTEYADLIYFVGSIDMKITEEKSLCFNIGY